MNVCMVAYTFYETDNRVRRYAEELARLGHHVDMFALRKKGVPAHAVINGVRLHRVQYRQYNERGAFSYLYRTLAFMLRVSVLLVGYHWKYRYRVLHIHNVPDFHVFIGLAPRLMGARVILDIHDILPEFFCEKFQQGPHSLLARLLRLTERLGAIR
ncbi:glycosyltransferase [bacterium]|nr:glycosyltransferase [bacterium]